MYPPKGEPKPQEPTKTQILIEFEHDTTAIGYKIVGSGSMIIHLGMLETVKGMIIAEKAVNATKQRSNIVPVPPGTRIL